MNILSKTIDNIFNSFSSQMVGTAQIVSIACGIDFGIV